MLAKQRENKRPGTIHHASQRQYWYLWLIYVHFQLRKCQLLKFVGHSNQNKGTQRYIFLNQAKGKGRAFLIPAAFHISSVGPTFYLPSKLERQDRLWYFMTEEVHNKRLASEKICLHLVIIISRLVLWIQVESAIWEASGQKLPPYSTSVVPVANLQRAYNNPYMMPIRQASADQLAAHLCLIN